MMIAAYEYPRYSTTQPQEQAVSNFRNEIEVTRC
jgi:hypothetical protein